jgi:ABC-type sugar transport system substrate-binding protein
MTNAILFSVALFLASVCQAFGEERLNVTFINPGGATEFWGDVAATMAAAADDLDIELDIIHTNRDRIKMVDAARNLAQSDNLPDYVVIVNELQQAPLMLKALEATGVPVFVLLNRMTPEQREAYEASGSDLSQLLASIVPDNEIAGYEMATSLIEEARSLGLDNDGITLLALLGDAATPAALAREAGMMRALAQNQDVELVRSFPVMWNADTAYERTASVLRRFDIDAIWAANDQIALGALRAAIEASETAGESIVFAGLNWSIDGLSAVRDGAFTMTHGGHFFAGAWSMVMLRDLADGDLPSGSHVQFPMSAIDAETVDRFQTLIGERAWGTIDYRAFTLGQRSKQSYDFTSSAILEATTSKTAEDGSL